MGYKSRQTVREMITKAKQNVGEEASDMPPNGDEASRADRTTRRP